MKRKTFAASSTKAGLRAALLKKQRRRSRSSMASEYESAAPQSVEANRKSISLPRCFTWEIPGAPFGAFTGEAVFPNENNLFPASSTKPELQPNSYGEIRSMIPRLTPENCVLLIVDVQTRLLPEMWEAQRVERNLELLATLARRLEIPVALSEQNPAKLGGTIDSLRAALGPIEPVAKMRFSAWPGLKPFVDETNRRTIILTGLESHICVSQTALDLIDEGFTVFLVWDAISSRQNWNRQIGWERMKSAGAIPSSTESAIYELLGEAGSEDFRALLPLVK